jgi:pimeloyl-ACP methyl ester carboxylesterase
MTTPNTTALDRELLHRIDGDVRAILPAVRVPTLVLHHTDDPLVPTDGGKYIADHISGAKYVELPGRNAFLFVEPDWRPSFQEVAEFLTGQQADVADDRVLATVLFTDVVHRHRGLDAPCGGDGRS